MLLLTSIFLNIWLQGFPFTQICGIELDLNFLVFFAVIKSKSLNYFRRLKVLLVFNLKNFLVLGLVALKFSYTNILFKNALQMPIFLIYCVWIL